MALIPTKKIPQLTNYGAALQGNEEFEIWVTNLSRRVTARDFVLPSDAIITAVNSSSTLPASRFLQAGAGIALIDLGPGNGFVIQSTGAGANPADPTALIGLTPVNGVLLSWMRSDSAPALSQAIAPTWTAPHVFTSLAGDLASAISLNNTAPLLLFNETDAAVNNRKWGMIALSEAFIGVAFPDVGAGTVWIQVDRTGTVIDTINLLTTSLLWNGSPILSAGTSFANPSALAGMAAVNGVATTAMRSDGAPAINPAIAPIWTGIHTFGAALRDQSTTLAVAGATNLDLSLGNEWLLNLNVAGPSAITFTNPPPAGRGQTITIYLRQDATGTRLVSWPASVHFSDGLTPVLTTTANRIDAVSLTTFDGGVTYYGGQTLANMVP